MAYLDDMPGLKDLYEKLMAQKESIESVLVPLRTEYNALQAQMAPLNERQRELGTQMKTITTERQLGAICNQLSAIARAAGGRSTSQAPNVREEMNAREAELERFKVGDTPVA